MLLNVFGKVLALLDWFLTEELKEESRFGDRQRARVIIGMSILGFFFTGSLALINLGLPNTFMYSIYSILGVCIFVPIAMRGLKW